MVSALRALVVVLVLILAGPAAAQREPAELSEAAVIEREAAVEVWVRLSRPVKYQSELMDSPWRLVLDFETTTYQWTVRPLAVGIDPVREVRGSQYRQGVARLVIELQRKVAFTIDQDREGLRIVLPRTAVAAPAPPAVKAAPVAAPPAVPPAAPSKPRPAPSIPPAPGGAVKPVPVSPAPVTPAKPAPGSSAPATPVKAATAAPAQPAPAGPRVHGIIMLESQAHAYIFDPATRQVTRFAVGDRLGDAVVETIGERHVVLRTPAGRVELRVEEARPASPPAPRGR